MFDAVLNDEDACRATAVLDQLRALRFPWALTGSLAIEAHLLARGQTRSRRPLNDVDLVVDSFAVIPHSVAHRFLLHHVHPFAAEGKILMQLVDAERAVRIDVFRAFGRTLSRSGQLSTETGSLNVVPLEDLIARTTAHVYGRIRASRTIAAKYASTFLELAGFGAGPTLAEAWRDHRGDIPGSFAEASRETRRLLALHPELMIVEEYSAAITPCDRCQNHAPFCCAPPRRIVEVLGYW
jgi:hypothetical protein